MDTILLVFRWLIRRDLSQFLKFIRIDEQAAIDTLRLRNYIGIVLERSWPKYQNAPPGFNNDSVPTIIGGAIYRLETDSIVITHLGCADNAVNHFYPALVETISGKLSQARQRTRAVFLVSECDLCSQIMLAEAGCIGFQEAGSNVVEMTYYI